MLALNMTLYVMEVNLFFPYHTNDLQVDFSKYFLTVFECKNRFLDIVKRIPLNPSLD